MHYAYTKIPQSYALPQKLPEGQTNSRASLEWEALANQGLQNDG